MRRWLPYPFLSLLLAALWLLLNETLAPVQLLAGLVAGVLGGRIMARLQRPLHRARLRLVPAAELAALVLVDIVQSNFAVARIVVRPSRNHQAGFLVLPLEARHPAALALLAMIITATPGTSWARYDAASNAVTIHMLDLADGEAWVAAFKERYERRLLEIFP